jgi:membrane-bound lytic murein transglycosylase A
VNHYKKTYFLFIVLLFLIIVPAFYYYYKGTVFSHVSLTKTTYDHLPNWKKEDASQALLAFQKSCVEILKRNPALPFSPTLPIYKTNAAWQTLCIAANKIQHPTPYQARQFFETKFQPYAVKNNFNSKGLFTGYYLPVLHGNLKKTKRYSVPLYSLPHDWVKIDLIRFNPEFKGKSMIGQLKNHTLLPYPDRAAIQQGALDTHADVIVWIDNIVDEFFAQIQGSAIVQLPNHQTLLLGFAGTNGQPYTAIGNLLIANKAIPKEKISMQTIRAWLSHHPKQVIDLLNQNKSYVFFIVLPDKNPLGTEHVPLTPQHSLAVDTRYIPFGAPLWLDTRVPDKKLKEKIFRHLLIAQDTGGAIKGIVRGDIYWGAGADAAFTAGHMQQTGRYWVLLPK